MTIERLGIIAGAGDLPRQLIAACIAQGIEPFLICFKGQTPEDLPGDHPHIWTTLGAAGKIIGYFKNHDIHDLVMIGKIKRPTLSDVSPDWKGAQILARIGMKAMGDNSLLSLLKEELETQGLKVRGVQEFCPDLLVGQGALGVHKPLDKHQDTINVGLAASQDLGARDVGQSVVVRNGAVVGSEDEKGTDALIKRCTGGGILVKTCKPQQDKSLDLPTIGLETIKNAHESGLCGIILQADNVIMVDKQDVIAYADRHNMFVVGVIINEA